MLTRRQFMKTAGVAGAGMCLGGLFTRPSPAQVSAKGVVIGQGVDLPSLDPYDHSVMANYEMWRHIHETLMKYDVRNRKYYGVLAESWKAEGTEWTFKLRKGVKFHNGEDFTAHDVVFSFERTMKSPKQASHLKPIKEMKVLDDHTLKLITHTPYAPIPIALQSRAIISKRVYEQGTEKALRNPIGTGPFKFIEWVRGSHLVARRNETYWGKPAQVEQVIWKPIPEDAGRITALETGAIDIATAIPPHETGRLEKRPGIRVERVRAMRSIHIGLPFRFAPGIRACGGSARKSGLPRRFAPGTRA